VASPSQEKVARLPGITLYIGDVITHRQFR
jgi:hypothetical protein